MKSVYFFIALIAVIFYFITKPPHVPTYHHVSESYRLTNLSSNTTIDNEIYDKYSSEWWKKNKGAFTGLHSITPVRIEYFEKTIQSWLKNKVSKTEGATENIVVADVGCGAGILTLSLAKQLAKIFRTERNELNIFGIDPAKNAIEEANNKLSEDEILQSFVSFEVASAEKLPMRTNSVDILIMSDVLEHIPDLRSAMKEISRVLKPGGLFLFDTMDRTRLSFFLFIRLAQQNFIPSLAVCPPNTHDYKLFIKPEEMNQLFLENKMSQFGEFEGILLKPFNIRTLLNNFYQISIKKKPFPEGGVLSVLGKFILVNRNKYGEQYAGAAIKNL